MAAISKKPSRSRTPKKSREELNAEGRERKRQKKHRGNPSGARQQDDARKTGRGTDNAVADPRIGSKKPVPLIAEGRTSVKPVVKKPAEPLKARLSPEEELVKLENDERLDALLQRLENNETLTAEENTYVDTMLERIDALMEKLGISLDEDDDEEKTDDIMQLLKGR